MKGGSLHLPNKFRRVPIGNHIKPVEPKLNKRLFGNIYRPITTANISSPINSRVILKRGISLTNGHLLKESTSQLPVNRDVYNGYSYYLGGPATKIETIVEDL